MKRGTRNNTKVKALARALGVDRAKALGTLAALWDLTAEEKPRGDIGAYSNKEIADEVFWDGDPDVLIQALVDTKCLDVIPCPSIRFYIHQWHKHCEDYIHMKLARTKQLFANGWRPKTHRLKVEQKNQLAPILRRLRDEFDAYMRTFGFNIPVDEESENIENNTNQGENNEYAHTLGIPKTVRKTGPYHTIQDHTGQLVGVSAHKAHTRTDLLWRNLRLSCGDFRITQDQLETWKKVYSTIDVELVIGKFERKYAVQDIKSDSVSKALATWLSTEDPQRQKTKSESFSIKDVVDFIPDMTPTEFSGDVFAAVVYYKNAMKYNRPEQIEAMKGDGELYRKVLEQIERDRQVDFVEESFDF